MGVAISPNQRQEAQRMKRRWTALFALAMLVSASLDLLSTYHVSPSLAGEANPLLNLLGQEQHAWVKLITIKAVAAALGVILFHLGLVVVHRRKPRIQRRVGYLETMGLLFYRERVSLMRLLLGWPRDWGAAGGLCGIVVGLAVAVGGLLGAVSNTFGLATDQSHVIALWVVTAVVSLVIGIGIAYRVLASGPAESSRTGPAGGQIRG
jgi:hypothetical protein